MNLFHWRPKILKAIYSSTVGWSHKLWYPSLISNRDGNSGQEKRYICTLDEKNICHLIDQNTEKIQKLLRIIWTGGK